MPSDGSSRVARASGPASALGVEYRLDMKSKDIVVRQLRDERGRLRVVQHKATGTIIFQKLYGVESVTSRQRRTIQREMQMVCMVASPFLVSVFEVIEELDKKQLAVCMEFMDVGSLDYVIRRTGPIGVDVLGQVVVATLEGLRYLYEEHRIMHRDVQPTNILINSRGEIKLSGFGLSKELEDSIAETYVGSSVTYKSPERLLGAVYSVKADTWSLGITVIELATGEVPSCEGGILQQIQSIVHDPPPALPDLDVFPESLRALVGKCLEKDLEQRPRPVELIRNDEFVNASKSAAVDMEKWAAAYPRRIGKMPDAEDEGSGRDNKAATWPNALEPPVLGFVDSLDHLIAMESISHLRNDEAFCAKCEKAVSSQSDILSSSETTQDELDWHAEHKQCPLCRLLCDCTVGPADSPRGLKPKAGKAVIKFGQLDDDISETLRIGRGFKDPTTGSHPAFQVAATWMKTCITKHTNCDTLKHSILPKRVVDVGPSIGYGPPFLHTSAPAEAGLYFTLTYRWGTDHTAAQFHTTMSRLEAYGKAIPEYLLPQTMKDAIYITRKFGVRYLWIDALCIVQDSTEDWLREAEQMAGIYQNSAMTIAAAADRSHETQGCFRTRSRRQARPVLCPDLRRRRNQQPDDSTEEEQEAGKGSSWCIFADRQVTRDGTRPQTQLDRRGWVLQEQVLSPRILYYAAEELYWDCTSLTASETFPDGIPAFYDAELGALDRRLFKGMIRSSSSGTTTTPDAAYVLWRSLVQEYSVRTLSHDADKLAAVLGLADRAAVVLEDRFRAGLWESRLAHELLWWVTDPAATRRPSGFEAPSWSWASVNAPISYDLKDRTPLPEALPCVEIVELKVQTNDAMAKIEGTIVARGRLVPLSAREQEEQSLSLPLPDWREDAHGVDYSAVVCLLVAASTHHMYAIGLVEMEGGENHYRRVGLACWSAGSSQLGWERESRTWSDTVTLETIVIR